MAAPISHPTFKFNSIIHNNLILLFKVPEAHSGCNDFSTIRCINCLMHLLWFLSSEVRWRLGLYRLQVRSTVPQISTMNFYSFLIIYSLICIFHWFREKTFFKITLKKKEKKNNNNFTMVHWLVLFTVKIRILTS